MARPKQTVLKALSANIPARSSVLLAISGGLDSSVLLHAAALLAGRKRLVLEVAHFDHRLRRSSGRDRSFVERSAGEHGLLCHIGIAEHKPNKGENVEAWARRERYAFLQRVAKERRLDHIATAHSADDVAETLLMRLLSNKELRSIEGMDRRRQLLRPLLSVARAEIERYAQEHDVAHVEDETNADMKFLRNRVRRKLIPFLAKEFDPRIVEVLSQRAQGLADDLTCLDDLVQGSVMRAASEVFGSKGWMSTVREELSRYPQTMQGTLVTQLFMSKLGFRLGRARAQAVVAFLRGNGAMLELPGRSVIRRRGGGITLGN